MLPCGFYPVDYCSGGLLSHWLIVQCFFCPGFISAVACNDAITVRHSFRMPLSVANSVWVTVDVVLCRAKLNPDVV